MQEFFLEDIGVGQMEGHNQLIFSGAKMICNFHSLVVCTTDDEISAVQKIETTKQLTKCRDENYNEAALYSWR